MGSIDLHAVRRVPGRLAYGCTDLSAVWPHGGTGLGATRGLTVKRYTTPYAVTIEGLGGEPVEYLEAGEAWGVGCRLRTFDDDALAVLFPNTAAGTTTQRRVVSAPGAVKAGEWMSTRAVALVFTPEGATHAQSATAPDVDAPFVVIYRAVPVLEDPEMRLSRTEEAGPPALFMAIRHASKGLLKIGQRRDLTL